MMAVNSKSDNNGAVVSLGDLPPLFPTHKHDAEFWEYLGRTIATFGFLEENLGRAIFAITATGRYNRNEFEEAYKNWLLKLEKALTDPLGRLISHYEKAIENNERFDFQSRSALVDDLREASKLRNVLCHGSWREPDNNGRSRVFFVSEKMEVFETQIDIACLAQVQQHVAKLACEVISGVTQTGAQFPGSGGPGRPVV